MSLFKAAVAGAVCGIICFMCIVCNMSKVHVNTVQYDAIAQIYSINK